MVELENVLFSAANCWGYYLQQILEREWCQQNPQNWTFTKLGGFFGSFSSFGAWSILLKSSSLWKSAKNDCGIPPCCENPLVSLDFWGCLGRSIRIKIWSKPPIKLLRCWYPHFMLDKIHQNPYDCIWLSMLLLRTSLYQPSFINPGSTSSQCHTGNKPDANDPMQITTQPIPIMRVLCKFKWMI